MNPVVQEFLNTPEFQKASPTEQVSAFSQFMAKQHPDIAAMDPGERDRLSFLTMQHVWDNPPAQAAPPEQSGSLLKDIGYMGLTMVPGVGEAVEGYYAAQAGEKPRWATQQLSQAFGLEGAMENPLLRAAAEGTLGAGLAVGSFGLSKLAAARMVPKILSRLGAPLVDDLGTGLQKAVGSTLSGGLKAGTMTEAVAAAQEAGKFARTAKLLDRAVTDASFGALFAAGNSMLSGERPQVSDMLTEAVTFGAFGLGLMGAGRILQRYGRARLNTSFERLAQDPELQGLVADGRQWATRWSKMTGKPTQDSVDYLMHLVNNRVQGEEETAQLLSFFMANPQLLMQPLGQHIFALNRRIPVEMLERGWHVPKQMPKDIAAKRIVYEEIGERKPGDPLYRAPITESNITLEKLNELIARETNEEIFIVGGEGHQEVKNLLLQMRENRLFGKRVGEPDISGWRNPNRALVPLSDEEATVRVAEELARQEQVRPLIDPEILLSKPVAKPAAPLALPEPAIRLPDQHAPMPGEGQPGAVRGEIPGMPTSADVPETFPKAPRRSRQNIFGDVEVPRAEQVRQTQRVTGNGWESADPYGGIFEDMIPRPEDTGIEGGVWDRLQGQRPGRAPTAPTGGGGAGPTPEEMLAYAKERWPNTVYAEAVKSGGFTPEQAQMVRTSMGLGERRATGEGFEGGARGPSETMQAATAKQPPRPEPMGPRPERLELSRNERAEMAKLQGVSGGNAPVNMVQSGQFDALVRRGYLRYVDELKTEYDPATNMHAQVRTGKTVVMTPEGAARLAELQGPRRPGYPSYVTDLAERDAVKARLRQEVAKLGWDESATAQFLENVDRGWQPMADKREAIGANLVLQENLRRRKLGEQLLTADEALRLRQGASTLMDQVRVEMGRDVSGLTSLPKEYMSAKQHAHFFGYKVMAQEVYMAKVRENRALHLQRVIAEMKQNENRAWERHLLEDQYRKAPGGDLTENEITKLLNIIGRDRLDAPPKQRMALDPKTQVRTVWPEEVLQTIDAKDPTHKAIVQALEAARGIGELAARAAEAPVARKRVTRQVTQLFMKQVPYKEMSMDEAIEALATNRPLIINVKPYGEAPLLISARVDPDLPQVAILNVASRSKPTLHWSAQEFASAIDRRHMQVLDLEEMDPRNIAILHRLFTQEAARGEGMLKPIGKGKKAAESVIKRQGIKEEDINWNERVEEMHRNAEIIHNYLADRLGTDMVAKDPGIVSAWHSEMKKREVASKKAGCP